MLPKEQISKTDAMPKLTNARGVWLGGISSGLISGLAMALFLMVYCSTGIGFFTPMQLIAGTFYGSGVESAGGTSAAVGLLFHLFNSAIIGLIFAAFIRYSTALMALVFGVATSILIWVIATFVAVPLLDPPLSRTLSSISGAWLFAHLLFGVFLMVTPSLVTHLSSPVRIDSAVANTREQPRAA
jgi:hypothetical protein